MGGITADEVQRDAAPNRRFAIRRGERTGDVLISERENGRQSLAAADAAGALVTKIGETKVQTCRESWRNLKSEARRIPPFRSTGDFDAAFLMRFE